MRTADLAAMYVADGMFAWRGCAWPTTATIPTPTIDHHMSRDGGLLKNNLKHAPIVSSHSLSARLSVTGSTWRFSSLDFRGQRRLAASGDDIADLVPTGCRAGRAEGGRCCPAVRQCRPHPNGPASSGLHQIRVAAQFTALATRCERRSMRSGLPRRHLLPLRVLRRSI
jgi:hypothetical protein